MPKINTEVSVDAFDSVDSEFQPFYEKTGEGEDEKYTLIDNEQVRGAVKSINGMKDALEKVREKEKKFEKVFSKFKRAGFGSDVDALFESVNSKLDEVKKSTSNKNDDFDIEEYKKTVEDKYKTDLENSTKEAAQLKNTLSKVLVENEIAKAIGENEGNVKLLKPILKQYTRLDTDGDNVVISVINDEGKKRLSGATEQPMTVNELVQEFKKDSTYSVAFKSGAKSGSGYTKGTVATTTQKTAATSIDKISQGLSKANY